MDELVFKQMFLTPQLMFFLWHYPLGNSHKGLRKEKIV